MDCREIVEFLADYLDGELSEEIQREFEEHLVLCPDCVAYLTTYAATPGVLRMACSDTSDRFPGLPDELVAATVAVLMKSRPAT